jgi:hypothetical protein
VFGRNRKGPAGHIQIVEPGQDPLERETLQCVHCGKHWVPAPGSGTQRGWCYRCAGPICGGKPCFTCIPFEAQIEIMEGAKTPMSRAFLDDWEKVKRGG